LIENNKNYNNMKTKVFIALFILIAAACGTNKEAKLEALKTKRDKINQQIAELEQEIRSVSDSLSGVVSSTFVSVEDVMPQPFNHYIEVQGKLDGDENLAIYPEVMGVVVEVNVKAGQQVKAGQVLACMNDAAYRDQLNSLQSNYDLALETFQKQENLWKQQIGSEIQYLQAKTTKESLESQIAAVKKQIDMTRIKSPINGHVEESLVKMGQAVSPTFPAFRVVNFNDIRVTADVAEAYTNKISTGDEVIVYLPDIKQEITAKVSFCSKFINTTNRTFAVEAQLKTGTDNLKANMVAILKINDYQAAKAFVLPVNLIQNDNKGQYILVASLEKNQYVTRKRAIQTGQIYNGLAEIVNGLEPGQKVITSGYLNLNEGETIRF
jgi:RND family efflux transporter MFP subunit